MLYGIESGLQKCFERHGAYNMFQELKLVLHTDAHVEMYETCDITLPNKMEENNSTKKGKGKERELQEDGKQVVAQVKKPKSGPKPETKCFYCNGTSHWKRNCPKYLADKKDGKVNNAIFDIHVIDVYFTSVYSNPSVFDTCSVAKSSNSKWELQNEQRLVKGEVTMCPLTLSGTGARHVPSVAAPPRFDTRLGRGCMRCHVGRQAAELARSWSLHEDLHAATHALDELAWELHVATRVPASWLGWQLHVNGGGSLVDVGLAVALPASLARALPGGPARIYMRPQGCLPELWPHADHGTGGRGLKGGSLCWCRASCPGKSLVGAVEATRQGACQGNLLRPSALCGLGLGVALIALGFDLTLAHLPRSAWCGRRRGSDCPCTWKRGRAQVQIVVTNVPATIVDKHSRGTLAKQICQHDFVPSAGEDQRFLRQVICFSTKHAYGVLMARPETDLMAPLIWSAKVPRKLKVDRPKFLSADDSGPLGVELTCTVRNDANATSEPGRYQRAVATLMNATADYAAYNSTRRYATGQADLDREFPKVYSWAQCTPDLTPGRCRDCLAQLIAQLPVQFTDSIGGRLLGPRCSFEYETKPFINGPVMVQLPATSASSGAPGPAVAPTSATAEGRKYSVPGMVLIILLPTIAAINLIVWLFSWRRRRQALAKAKQPDPNYSTDEAEDMESVESMLIDISTLRAATEDFAESNKLGKGGFGPVYKGTLLNGDEIAVKRMSKSSTQGVEELKNELALVAKLKHKNLVRLVGVCLEQQERLLIYEFVPNRSLDLILFDEAKRQKLDWETRFKIINGVARGLQYLHEDSQLKVIHRDLKASNVLLDMNMNPKISDFGLAKIFGRDQTQGVTNRVIGTYGYMAPEYVMRGNYSVKSDAFSFGVLVLEIMTGKKNRDCYNSQQSQDLLTTRILAHRCYTIVQVWEHWVAETVLEVVDPCMNKSFSESDALRCIHVGLLCIQGNPADRPMMSTVAMMLGSNTFSLPTPSKPAFYTTNDGANSSTGSSVSIPSVQARS
ncbi:Cysteine-rich receptor-like protein kinase 25 [Triticum urartu]|uniref:Cysteine-rich receptor-like protein kinase 25 n=1 Tax=Triticum urartu TaxID=4572 RepID=M8AZN9_TRIUA|nr:Cysteine-rich receptor-like protein kinase 25 [Triticum urartu]